MSQPDYRPLCELWPVSGKVTVSFEPFLELEIKLPVDFLVKSGDNSLAFLQHLAQQVVVETGHLCALGEAGSSLDLNARPEIGASYHFRPLENRLTHARGPEGKDQRKAAPAVTDGESTVSGSSSRSSSHQSPVRADIMMRDGGDLFADVSGKKCDAAHLVPVSRPDVYKEILDVEFLYDVSYGLAMEKSLHHAYVYYKWSIYCKDERYYFHAFDGSDPDLVKLHGKSFSVKDVRHLAPPDPRLCAWHYRQATLKYVRGFAIGVQIGAQ